MPCGGPVSIPGHDPGCISAWDETTGSPTGLRCIDVIIRIRTHRNRLFREPRNDVGSGPVELHLVGSRFRLNVGYLLSTQPVPLLTGGSPLRWRFRWWRPFPSFLDGGPR